MKTLKYFISLINICLLTACASSEIALNVIDANTRAPVPNAYVYLGDKMHLSDSAGKVRARTTYSNIAIYAGKDEYFSAKTNIKTGTAPRRNGVIISYIELYPLPDYPKRIHRPFSFAPSKNFTEKHIENTPNLKEFLTYLVNQKISVYNFTTSKSTKNTMLKVYSYETKEPLANCYVLATKKATIFSPQKDYLFITNDEGYIDIAIKDYDRFLIVKEGYDYKVNNILKSEKLQKELYTNLSLYEKDERNAFAFYDNCLKISKELLGEYPINKKLQAFLKYLDSIDVIIARLPENEIVDIQMLKE